MLRTRLWVGAILIALVVGMLVLDDWLPPWYPFLFATLQILGVIASLELLALLPAARRPSLWLCLAAVLGLLLLNWPAHLLDHLWQFRSDPWHWVLGAYTVVVMSAFLVEMAAFRAPGESVTRIALTLLIAAYLGLLPSFLAQLRWLERAGEAGGLALALAVFVPKSCDIAAYLTGRFLGRSRMTPVLSPKKTWEGFVGGLVGAVLAAVAINAVRPEGLFRGGAWAAVGFGLSVGVMSVLGDLAESLIKRDCGQKDASQSVPGFGGVLDVVDSIVFAAPAAYCWLLIL
jgi:phosphatidate cytidylyltransferase